jgi:hypothetical protein
VSDNIIDNVAKEKLEAWTSRTSLGKEIDVSKTILKISRTFPKPSL